MYRAEHAAATDDRVEGIECHVVRRKRRKDMLHPKRQRAFGVYAVGNRAAVVLNRLLEQRRLAFVNRELRRGGTGVDREDSHVHPCVLPFVCLFAWLLLFEYFDAG